jgi:hypothetical protein
MQLAYPVSGGYKYGGLVLQVEGWSWDNDPTPQNAACYETWKNNRRTDLFETEREKRKGLECWIIYIAQTKLRLGYCGPANRAYRREELEDPKIKWAGVQEAFGEG